MFARFQAWSTAEVYGYICKLAIKAQSQGLTHSLRDGRKRPQMLPLPFLHNGSEITEL